MPMSTRTATRPGRCARPEPVPGCPGHAAAGGDGGYRGHGLVDLVGGVVEVEAQAAAGGRGQPERVVGERGAVAARAGLHPGPVQGLGHADRITAGEVERDQRGAPRRVAGPVDGDPGDGGRARPAPGRSAADSSRQMRSMAACTAAASDGPGRSRSTPGGPGVSARSSSRRSACAETIAPRMLGVPAAYFQGSALYSTRSGNTRPSAIMSPPYRNGSEDAEQVLPGRTAPRPRTGPASCGRRTPGSPRRGPARR